MIMLPEGAVATGEKMSVQDRRKILRFPQERYLNASRSAKSAMLDAMEADTHI